MPHAQTGETPCIQRHYFGAVIAPRLAVEQGRQRLKQVEMKNLCRHDLYHLSAEQNLPINRFVFQ
jgi:hypothetical protein